MDRRRGAWAAIVWVLLVACGARVGLAEHPATDIPYATVDGKPLLLDIYPAKGAAGQKSPCVIWIHGGGWYAGSKENPRCLPLVDHGFVVASIAYRLTNEASFPAQIHDCKAAVRWLRAHADEHGIDPDRIGVMGISAGGHLAALLGTSGDVAELEGKLGVTKVSSRVQAVVEGYGPSDFEVMLAEISKRPTSAGPGKPTNLEAVEALLKRPTREESEALAKLASPVTHVRKGLPPFFIFHGTADRTVPSTQSEILHERLRAFGNDSTLELLPGVGHSVVEPAIQAKIVAFFSRTLEQPAP